MNTNETDIAVTTRIRLARNIKKTPYPRKMTPIQATELIEKVKSAFDNSPIKDTLKTYEFYKQGGNTHE